MYRIVAIASTLCGCWLADASAQTIAFDAPVLRYDLTPRTGLVVQPAEAPRRPWMDEGSAAGIGLEFKSRNNKKGLPPNLLRVQMTQTSTLQFRPRGGGLAVTYREQF